MENGWTGGQWSLIRAAIGAAIGARAFMLLCVEAPGPVTLVLAGTLAGSVALTVGWQTRAAALSVIACLGALALLTSLASEPALFSCIAPAALLAAAPASPFGSWDARGRIDPGARWRLPGAVYAGAWIFALCFFAPQFTSAGAASSASLLTLSAIALALGLGVALVVGPRGRAFAWIAMVATTLMTISSNEVGLAPWFLLAMAFDPGWIPPKHKTESDTLYYDGHCALCHGIVRFVLAEERTGTVLDFVALQDAPEIAHAADPNDPIPLASVVFDFANGERAFRSAAACAVLAKLGGLWRVAASILWVIPTPLRDRAYDAVARFRLKIFGTKAETCPVVPPTWRHRFSTSTPAAQDPAAPD